MFPGEKTFNENIFNDVIDDSHPGYQDLMAFREQMMQYTLSEIQQIYTDTFDFSKKHHYI